VREIRPTRSNGNALEIHDDVAVDFLNRKDLKAFRRDASGARLQTELMAVQRTDDISITDNTFGERPLCMRTLILTGEYPAIPLSEDCKRLSPNDKATTLSQWNGVDTAKIDRRWVNFFSHYFLQPPRRKPTRVR